MDAVGGSELLDRGAAPGDEQPIGRHRERVERLWMAGLIALYTLHVLRLVHTNIDDAYMLYRYAANIARGAGMTFTAGVRVEGFTTLLYTLVLAVFYKVLHLDVGGPSRIMWMTITSKAIGFACGVWALFYLSSLVRRVLRLPFSYALLSLLSVVLCSNFTYSTTNGLETGFVILLYTAMSTHLVSWGFDRSSKRDLVSALGFACALALSRADGIVMVGAVVGSWLVAEFAFRRPSLSSLLRQAVTLGVPPLVVTFAYACFRRSYFGLWFPQSYYVKFYRMGWDSIMEQRWFWNDPPTQIHAWERIPLTFRGYVLPGAWGYFVMVGLFAVYVLFRSGKASSPASFYRRKDLGDMSPLQAVAALVLPMLPLTLYVSTFGDWIPAHRMLMHYMVPAIVVLTGAGLRFASELHAPRSVQHLAYGAVAALTLGTAWSSEQYYDRLVYATMYEFSHADPTENTYFEQQFAILRGMHNLEYYTTVYRDFWADVADEMAPGDTAAIFESGYSSLALGDSVRLIDLSGLNDRRMAVPQPGEVYTVGMVRTYYACDDNKPDPKGDYILSMNPKLVIFDTFQLRWCERFPLKLYKEKYRLIDFPHNDLGFFSVYIRVGANTPRHGYYPNMRCSPACVPDD